ncbi:DUF3549 family protein [Vibrio sp. Of7-15]|uniref:DUF3549 family protein n=1 Tax=Vibrio sp. Of7-15 TaxID=2724879 RepID=UPI001EF17391|nr:DUF3549 family protein [Vibrio sp. Of7-15]MCG7498380.1 DUF3549 family protein [Vibrio sp. Of7-15]
MDTIHTLSELLNNANCQYQIYDLGRRVQPIDNQQFESVEASQQPYPYPLQKHAHLAIAFWNDVAQPWVWFLKLPLDERSLLKQADMGNFIKFVIEATGLSLNKQPTEEQQQKLANNPYTFKPQDDKMAMFHSLLRVTLKQPTSQYYEHTIHYLEGGLGWNNWQTVGLQGLADVCARLNEQQNGVIVRKALTQLPTEPLYALLGCLEHSHLPTKLAERLLEFTEEECKSTDPDLFLISALIRALSGAESTLLKKALTAILASERLSHPEVLIGIAGRSWQALQDTTLASQYLLRLAQTGNQSLFNQLFADLVMQPTLRLTMLQILNSEADPALHKAIAQLQQSTKQQ